MTDQCPNLDAPAEFNDFTVQGMCKQGSLTFIVAFGIFLLLFIVRQILHYLTTTAQAEQQRRGGYGLAQPEREGLEKVFHPRNETNSIMLHVANKYLVLPFVPVSLKSLIMMLYLAWVAMTIPMATTRYYKKLWANEVMAQQGPLNVIADMLGCEGVDIMAIPYTKQINDTSPFQNPKHPPERNSPEELDPYFAWHLAFGIVWLTFGFVQIFNARGGWSPVREVSGKAHRIFGKFFAIPAFCCHMYCAYKMIVRNPVNQNVAVVTQYWATLIDSCLLCINGVWCISKARSSHSKKEKDSWQNKHILRMGMCYFESVFGSGSIRLTAWALWLFAKFWPHKLAMRIDRGICQSYAECRGQQVGSAQSCFIPVFLNLALTDILILWIEFLFISLPETDFAIDESDLKVFKQKTKAIITAGMMFLPMLLFEQLDNFTYPLLFVYALFGRVESIWIFIGYKFPAEKRGGVFEMIQRVLRKVVFWPGDDDDNDELRPHQD